MSETKLTRLLDIPGFKHIQTQKQRSGSCWVGSKQEKTKAIKALGSAVCWIATAFQYVPIHIITCYFTPGNKKKTDESIEKVIHIVGSI